MKISFEVGSVLFNILEKFAAGEYDIVNELACAEKETLAEAVQLLMKHRVNYRELAYYGDGGNEVSKVMSHCLREYELWKELPTVKKFYEKDEEYDEEEERQKHVNDEVLYYHDNDCQRYCLEWKPGFKLKMMYGITKTDIVKMMSYIIENWISWKEIAKMQASILLMTPQVNVGELVRMKEDFESSKEEFESTLMNKSEEYLMESMQRFFFEFQHKFDWTTIAEMKYKKG